MTGRSPMIGRSRLSTVALVAVTVAVTVALASGAASAAAGGDEIVQYSHADGEEPTADGHLDDGGLYWQGQAIGFEDPDEELNTSSLYLREYSTGDDQLGDLVSEIEFDDEGMELDTDDLAGTYVLTPSSQRDRVVTFDEGAVTGTTGIEDANAFEIQQQSLEVDWEGGQSDTVRSDRELELESNRVRYNVNVSSPSLSFDQLEAVFMGDRGLRDQNRPFEDRKPFDKRHRMYDTYEDEDKIVLRGFSDGTLETDFSQIDSFPDGVTVEVTDTGVTRSTEPPSDAAESGPFSISELEITDTVDPGESVSVSATLSNDWSTTESGEVAFELGDSSSSVSTTLAGGEETTVSATLTAPEEPGEVDYAVTTDGDRVDGTVTVQDPNPEPEDDGSDDGNSGGIVGTVIGLLYPQALVGLIMTALSVATFVVWRRR